MPFDESFDEVYQALKGAAAEHEIECLRADQIRDAGFVMGQIQEQIDKADLVIADLTGRNANVFYETAIAHRLKDPHKVILIAQDVEDVPFDLRHLRCLFYASDSQGIEKLRTELIPWIERGLRGRTGPLLEIIEDRRWRTERIVTDLGLLLNPSHSVVDSANSLVVRFSGGLSPLSIDDPDPKSSDLVYRKSLADERNGVLRLVHLGATFRAIIAPRALLVGGKRREDYMTARYERLIRVLGSDEALLPLDRVEIALIEPSHIGSVYILGENILYEGIKTNIKGGFDLTIRLTDEAQISARLRAFDALFQEARKYTLARYAGSPKDDSPSTLRQACLVGVKEAYQAFKQGEYYDHEVK